MTTQTPAGAASTDEPVSATPISVSGSAATSVPNATQAAKQQEEQWRIPQLLTALVTPILGLISVIFNLSGINNYANIAGVLAIVTGATAALIAVAMWRSDRAATGQS